VQSPCTTISCRFIAPTTIVAALLLSSVAAGIPRAASWQSLPTAQRWAVALSAAPSGPPVPAGALLVVPLQSGTVAAFHIANGSAAWTHDARVDQPIAADEERVYVVAGGGIHALQASTGAVLWRADAPPVTAPLLVRSGWLIAASASGVSAFRASDGSCVWSADVGPVQLRSAIDGDRLFVPVADGHVVALTVQSGAEAWRRKLGGVPGEPLAVGGRVYVGGADKFFYALDASSGRVDWQMQTGAAPRGQPAADDDHVYFAFMDNLLRALDRGEGALRWKQGLPYRPSGGPLPIGGSIVAPGPAAALRAFRAADGAPAGAIELGATATMAPALVAGEHGAVLLAAVTGSLEGRWTLALFEPALVPWLPVVPLKELPGAAFPLAVPGR
jgi:outer membrane protein assembly factor BamB